MQPAVLSLALVVLCCSLQARAEVAVQPDFQDDKMVGRWYSIGLASNSRWFQSKKHALSMCTALINSTADGNLEVTSTYHKHDRCEKKIMTFIKTEEPGRFRATIPRWGSEHDIRVVETNYDEYALVYNRKAKGTEFFTMVTLYGRSKNLRPELFKKFEKFALEQGLPQSSIVKLPLSDQCMTDA